MNSMQSVQLDLIERMSAMKLASTGAAVRGAFEPPTQIGGISQAFEQVLRSIDAEQHRAGQAQADVDSGKSKDLVGAMILSQKASLSFSALLQVRNKVSSAFDEIMRMPV
ncbi:Flagellar hook-basal body complex protein FliE [bioreactor metagenome]|uniref:Flagellar hook-basal body complex protein FliE n=2 Tax=root TaxID=1 RepID=A0A323UWT0_9RHOO|nr:flagellar hook-basal body complex protein FliE [Parazoarcus communis]NMG69060.1 flagellar hook-basal body protein FliE [Parazoarcus communis SWub3 = DSM 12120]PZA16917.1 flagellar hook-basal body protein FliE [Azoarcus communis] [Parazoarcus communis SWub3 = DSM 12120]